MVGVAGKSKACKDCKRRRVKCDFGRPGCLRCSKANIQCSGYDQQVLFINRTLKDPSVSAPTVLARFGSSRTSPRSINDELGDLIALSRAASISSSGFRSQAFRLLQKLYLPQPAVSGNDLTNAAPFSWVKAACELEAVDEVLDHALVAFCTAQVYVTESGNISHGEALEQYNVALRMLSVALTRETTPKSDYILASIVVLSSCELFICPTDDGWRAHVQGIADLLQLRHAHSLPQVPTGIWNRLCSRLRVMTVLSQLTRRQKGSLTAAQWNELMPNYPNIDPLDKLMDIACELPLMLEAADLLMFTKESSEHDQKAVIGTLISIVNEIYAYQVRLQQSSEIPLYTTAPSQLVNPVDDAHPTKLFPFAIAFRSLQVAGYFVVSWAILVQIYASLLPLYEHIWGNVSVSPTVTNLLMWCRSSAEASVHNLDIENSTLPLGSIKDEADKLARYLCQSIEYCHRMDMGTFGPQMMLYSQWVMRIYFRQVGSERELQWCLNVENMHGPATRCGIKMMVFQG